MNDSRIADVHRNLFALDHLIIGMTHLVLHEYLITSLIIVLRNENELEGVVPFDAFVKLGRLGKCRLYVRANYNIGLPVNYNWLL